MSWSIVKIKCIPTLTDEIVPRVKYINKEDINQQFLPPPNNKIAGFKKCELVKYTH